MAKIKIIKGDLVLTKDTVFNESIEVKGNIRCGEERKNLTVRGDINARNIDALDIDAQDIKAGDIDARNIHAWKIKAGDIDAGDIKAGNIDAVNIKAGDIDALDIKAMSIYARIIFVEKINRTALKKKINAFALIENRSQLSQKEFE